MFGEAAPDGRAAPRYDSRPARARDGAPAAPPPRPLDPFTAGARALNPRQSVCRNDPRAPRPGGRGGHPAPRGTSFGSRPGVPPPTRMSVLPPLPPPDYAAPADGVEASVLRALREAEDGLDAAPPSPCAFRPLAPDAVRRIAPPRSAGRAGRWIVVTCRTARGRARRADLHERCLTAAQRFMLSLSCDGVDNGWVAEAPDAEAFRTAGVALDGGDPVGLIWYGSGER